MKKTIIVEEMNVEGERRFKVKRLRNLTRPPVGSIYEERDLADFIGSGIEVIVDTPRAVNR